MVIMPSGVMVREAEVGHKETYLDSLAGFRAAGLSFGLGIEQTRRWYYGASRRPGLLQSYRVTDEELPDTDMHIHQQDRIQCGLSLRPAPCPVTRTYTAYWFMRKVSLLPRCQVLSANISHHP